MKHDRKQWIYLIFQWVLTLSVIAAGICLMIACLQIYRSGGEQIYTPEKVAAAFRPIAVPVYICLGLSVVSFVLPLFLQQKSGKAPRRKDSVMELRRLQLTRDINQADKEKQVEFGRFRRFNRIMQIVCCVLCAFFFGLFLSFALTHSNFYPDAADATDYVISLMPQFSSCVTLCLGLVFLSALLSRKTMEKQIAILKQCPPRTAKAAPKKAAFATVVRYAVLGLAVVFMVYGLATGGWQDVLTKAVNICTECVGLG